MFKDASRINHTYVLCFEFFSVCRTLIRSSSCSPNVTRFFNRQTFGIEIRALRTIKKGEEITTNYTDITTPTAERQDDLAPYGFQCACRACRVSKKSDLLRFTLAKNDPQTLSGRRLVVWLMNPGLPESYVVDPCFERLKAIEAGGMEISDWYSKTVEYLFRVYCAMGNASEAFKCEFTFPMSCT